MTKAEELNILTGINELIIRAGMDSYIGMTFAGIVDVCRKNIENDFGDSPVKDLDDMREAYFAESRMHDETKRMLAEAQKMCKEALDMVDAQKAEIKELTEERDVVTECLDDSHELLSEQDGIIHKLKADVMRMRMERMTDAEIAELYDRTECD